MGAPGDFRQVGPARQRHVVAGRVQGVGFRPFVYRLARQCGLTGFVQNAPQGVVIEVQGGQSALDAFRRDLPRTLPPLALLVEHTCEDIPIKRIEPSFTILQSLPGAGHNVLVSPDIATCPDCLADMADPAGRRHDYPFTNCTNCGPRYTITRSVPYDRATTSMACFPLCPQCAAEYQDPEDRRFHAQPNACPVCGPQLWLTDARGIRQSEGRAALHGAAQMLAAGHILALKGLGGFHLAVDARNHAAVAELRRRKRRPSKPLAVMAAGLEHLEQLAFVDKAARSLLESPQRPIVLCPLRPEGGLSPEISPDTDLVGAMLPYTPLHHVLLADFARLAPQAEPAALVMTSGNLSSEPIALGNREALERLAGLADAFLLHNRDILVRTDDSVLHPGPAGPEFLRRARGFTPQPVFLPKGGPCALGVGPELKNTVCFTKDDQAFVSQHVGDMQNLDTSHFHAEVIRHLEDVLQVTPEVVVADLHPDYLSTRYALERGGRILRLQHHYAHILAVAAENKLLEPVIGLAMDGSGFGEDGTIWGGEFLFVNPATLDMRRLGHLRPVRLPGGEAAIRHPWRMAQAYFHALGHTDVSPSWSFWAGREKAASLVASMLNKDVNCPSTTSCGRLFDAVSAVLGLCHSVSYEGQAAIILEHIQDFSVDDAYPCPVMETGQTFELDTLNLFTYAAREFVSGVAPGAISRRFHLGLAQGMTEMAVRLAAQHGLNRVAVSGGVFHNRTLSGLVAQALTRQGLHVAVHRQTPCGDGCISLGQAFYGQRMLVTGQ